MSTYSDEFPLLEMHGLYAADIRGDGNCLFNALSDQMYGTQDEHLKIRSRVIEYMKTNAAYYKQFLEVYPGGGTRRNPKRKNAGSFTSTANVTPSSADVDRVFDEHINRMAKGGTWGDNMELQAFAAAYDSNVKIYQRAFAYMISAPGGDARPCQHIAYHDWEHYSSVRNIDGPHEGLPQVTPKPMTPAQEEQQQSKLLNSSPIMPWQISALSKAYPTADTSSIKRALEEAHGSVDDAYEKLLAADEMRSVSSQQSSSVERDGDDEVVSNGPNKRRDRRLSRASRPRASGNSQTGQTNIATRLQTNDDSLESLLNVPDTSPRSMREARGSQRTETSDDDDDEDDWTPDPLRDGDTSSGSEYSTPAPESTQSTIRIKLSLPKDDIPQLSEPSSKPNSPNKKPLSARDKRDMKKQAQKQAAKARKQLAMGNKKVAAQSATSSMDSNPLHTVAAATAMKTLYI